MPSTKDLRRAARSLHQIAEKTAGLPGEEAADRTLQDRLELVADVIDAAAEAEERPLER
ncbi:MAG TPA: hypothetical protein VK428_15690 [Acidimicrobiales bacterium]|nr:hypothetical protein [Acidimicrobiales bacterium]